MRFRDFFTRLSFNFIKTFLPNKKTSRILYPYTPKGYWILPLTKRIREKSPGTPIPLTPKRYGVERTPYLFGVHGYYPLRCTPIPLYPGGVRGESLPGDFSPGKSKLFVRDYEKTWEKSLIPYEKSLFLRCIPIPLYHEKILPRKATYPEEVRGTGYRIPPLRCTPIPLHPYTPEGYREKLLVSLTRYPSGVKGYRGKVFSG